MKYLLFIYILIFNSSIIAQNNLVPNGSFENISTCPSNCIGATTSTVAIGWKNPNIGSSDLFSNCDSIICAGWNRPCHSVPSNCWGYQPPFDGNNYAGVVIYAKNQSNVREYLEIELIDSLLANKKYCMSFYTSIADSFSGYATSRLGSYVSKNSITSNTQYLISQIPQVENIYNNYLNNYTSWTSVQGLYHASGGENYITIGNFYDDVNTDTLRLHFNSYSEAAYYYIDQVSLVEYNEAFAGRDTTICTNTYVTLGDYTSTFGANYNWSVASGDSGSISNGLLNSIIVSPKKNTTYVLQKQQCGISSFDTIIVKIPMSYIANAGEDTTLCLGDTALIGVNNCSWCNYNWQNISINTSIINASPLTTTTYTLHLKDSCTTTTSLVTIKVDFCQSPIIVVPNIFTPNSDGINDIWIPLIQNQLSVLNYQCVIYDRWGVKIFDTTNYTSGFDGHTTSGIIASEGTYFYMMTYTDAKTNESKRLNGFLELIR